MEKKSVFSTLTVVTCVAVLLPLAFCNSTDSRLKRGSVNLELGDYQRAQMYFGLVLDDSPTSLPARIGLGKALLQQFAANPKDSSALVNSLIQFEAAQTLRPDTAIERLLGIAWFKRTSLHLASKDTLAAFAALSRSISLDPSSVKPLNLAGILYFHRGDHEKAINLFKKTTTIDSGSASGYFNTGMVHWADSNFTDAYECFFAAAKRSPEDREILLWTARAQQAKSKVTP